MFVLIRFLDGLRVPEDQISGRLYPSWVIVVFACTLVGLAMANCWYAYHSRMLPVNTQTAKEAEPENREGVGDGT
jgi:hypothetical protein